MIVGINGDASGEFQRQRSEGLGEAQLRLDGPAVGPDIHEFIGVVLAEGSRYLQAGPQDEILLIAGKLLQGERGGAIEVYGETESWVADAGPLPLAGLACHVGGSREPGIRYHHIDLPGPP